MSIFKNNPIEEKILAILRKRGISDHLKSYCSQYTNGRTKKLSELFNNEQLALLQTLSHFTDEIMLKGIYDVATELGIFSNGESERDLVIINFLKQANLIKEIGNSMQLTNADGAHLDIMLPLKESSYLSKCIIANHLSEQYLNKLRINN